MGRVELDLCKVKDCTIKYGKEKIVVNRIINTIKAMEIVDICIQQFKNKSSLPLIKTIFDICVLALQTNIDINEVKEINSDNKFELNLSIDSECVEYYENSGIFSIINKNIINYSDLWNMVIKSIEMENTTSAFNKVVETLPNEAEMNSSIEIISKFAKENPELVKGIIKNQMVDKAKETAKSETREKIENTKAENLAKVEIDKIIAEKKLEIKSKNKTK